jgi:hypothetical protein
MLQSPPFLLFVFLISPVVMVVAIVGIVYWHKARGKELQVPQDMRIREMEHERKLKEMEIEKAKLEFERARAGKNQ